MALIRFAEGQQRSGSIGGSTYSHNRYGAYIRNRSIPVNPNTDRQVEMRNVIRGLTIAWQNTLTQFQRDWWDTYGDVVPWTNKFGDTVYLTGLSHYVRYNSVLVQSGFTRRDDGPTVYNLAPAEDALVVTASEATQLLSAAYDDTAAWADETGSYQFFTMGIPQNASRTFFGGPWRLAGYVAGVTGAPPASPTPLNAPWPIVEGQRIWVRTRIARADGRLSQFAQYNFLCAA